MNIYSQLEQRDGFVGTTLQIKHAAPKIDYLANVIAQVSGYMYVKECHKKTYLGCSRGLIQLFGLSEFQQIIGKTTSEIMSSVNHKSVSSLFDIFQHYEELVIANKTQFIDILSEPCIHSTGRVVQLKMTFTPIINRSNKVEAIQCHAEDISAEYSPQELLKLYQDLYPNQNLMIHMYLEHIGFSKYVAEKNSITKRELDILLLFSCGKTAKEIARLVYISPRTVEKHLDKIKEKINVRNRIQLMRIFISCFG